MRPRPIAAALGATALLAAHLIAPPAALAIAPPVIDPGALPPNDTPGPTEEMKQNKACVTPVVIADPDVAQPPPGNAMLDVTQAWQYSTGAGVSVALIDTGVTPNPRFPSLFRRRGLCDGAGQRRADRLREPRHRRCLHHRRGTVQPGGEAHPPPGRRRRAAPAARRAGQPGTDHPATAAAETHDGDRHRAAPAATPAGRAAAPDTPPANGPGDPGGPQPLVAGPPPAGPDGVVGVAPDATLISIRQSSTAFGPARPDPNDPDQLRRKAGDILTLARAIRHAADLGVKVINVSVASCINAATPVNQDPLGAAIRYAVVDKDVVVVTAAGNRGETSDCGQNPAFNPLNPNDPRDWAGVRTIVSPGVVLRLCAHRRRGHPRRAAAARLDQRAVGVGGGAGLAHHGAVEHQRRGGQRPARPRPRDWGTTSGAPASRPPTCPVWSRWCARSSRI